MKPLFITTLISYGLYGHAALFPYEDPGYTFTEIKLPDAIGLPDVNCEEPYTGKLQYILKKARKGDTNRLLMNAAINGEYSCNPLYFPEDQHWFGMVLNEETNEEMARLEDTGNKKYVASKVYAITDDFNYAVGFATTSGFGKSEGAPVFWELKGDTYQSTYLELPPDGTLLPSRTVLPQSISNDGLIIYGSTQFFVTSQELLKTADDKGWITYDKNKKPKLQLPGQLIEKHNLNTPHKITEFIAAQTKHPGIAPNPVVFWWVRSKTTEPFKLQWLKPNEGGLSNSFANIQGATPDGQYALVDGINNDSERSSFLMRFNATSGLMDIVQSFKTMLSYGIDQGGKYAWLRENNGTRNVTMQLPLESFATGDGIKIIADNIPPAFRLGTTFGPYAYQNALSDWPLMPYSGLEIEPVPSTIRIPQDSGPGEFVPALDFFKNKCGVTEMNHWNEKNWHQVFFGDGDGVTNTYYGLYDRIGAPDILYSLTINLKTCNQNSKY